MRGMYPRIKTTTYQRPQQKYQSKELAQQICKFHSPVSCSFTRCNLTNMLIGQTMKR